MRTRLSAILILLFCSLAFAFSGEARQPNDDDNTVLSPLFMVVNSSCDGNLITLTTTDDAPVEDADVVVWIVGGSAIVIDKTDANGHIYFERCSAEVEIDAHKADHIPINNFGAELINCSECEEEPVVEPCECGYLDNGQCIRYECCSDNECSEDELCQGYSCVPRPECYDDGDCMDTHYCYILPGETGGMCNPVTGSCGYVQNHSWVRFNCGSADNNCTECPQGYSCELQGGTPPTYECIMVPVEPIEEEKTTTIFSEEFIFAALLMFLIIAIMIIMYFKKRSESDEAAKD